MARYPLQPENKCCKLESTRRIELTFILNNNTRTIMWVQQWNKKRKHQAYNLPAKLIATNTYIFPMQPVAECTATWKKCAIFIVHMYLLADAVDVSSTDFQLACGERSISIWIWLYCTRCFIVVSVPPRLLQHIGFSLTTGISLLDIVSQWKRLMLASERRTDVCTPYHNVQMSWHKYTLSFIKHPKTVQCRVFATSTVNGSTVYSIWKGITSSC